MTRRIQSIVIVGGGTAGWLTAGIIAARHQGRMKAGSFSVTLVESPNVPIIGVGEGTWPTLRSTLQKMGVSETEFFRHCNAAFKQGAKFRALDHRRRRRCLLSSLDAAAGIHPGESRAALVGVSIPGALSVKPFVRRASSATMDSRRR